MTRKEAIKELQHFVAFTPTIIKTAIEKALESLKQPEIIYCKDCCYWSDKDGIVKQSDGVRFARCTVHNYIIEGRHTGWCPTENDYCSYAERKDD